MTASPARLTARAFSLVEILIVVLLIGILSAVAIPRLLGAGQVVGDGAAQQQLDNTGNSLATYRTDTGSYSGIGDVNSAGFKAVQKSEPDIVYVVGSQDSAVNGDARSVSIVSATVSGNSAAIAASLGEDGNCWYLRLVDGAATEYGVKRNSGTSCKANDAGSATFQTQTWPDSLTE